MGKFKVVQPDNRPVCCNKSCVAKDVILIENEGAGRQKSSQGLAVPCKKAAPDVNKIKVTGGVKWISD